MTRNEALDGELREQNAAERFYDDRFKQGYMSEWPHEKRARVRRLIASLGLPGHGRALDFGCGTGVFTSLLKQALPSWQVDGTDLSTVAVETAAARWPGCSFFPFSECERLTGQYDFIFTHHVLEHVPDLPGTARLLDTLLKPQASMFHILPCGNPGSFEHGVCLIRTDGIRQEPEPLFFFDEEGHLRRLDTIRIEALWKEYGYRIGHEWYGSQHMGGVRSRTAFGLEDVFAFADPAKGRDEPARRRLRRLRSGMTALWMLRKPVAVVRVKRKAGCHTLRDYVLLGGGLATYPIGWATERILRHLESREWSARNQDRAGSEMYIHLVRPSP